MKRKHIVVLTGAGISAESGLKTFRDSDGLWNGYNVYEVATPDGWRKNPQLVLDFYNARRKDIANASPNEAHTGLALLEKNFDVTVITQNIDDLHERGGSSHVLHLHGEIFKMRSEKDIDLVYEIAGNIYIGDKADDGFQLRPFIVWFNEPVPMIEKAIEATIASDYFIVIGTSLQVYPAASLLQYVPAGVPRFIVDKHLPDIPYSPDIIAIEKTATEGIKDIIDIFNSLADK